MKPSTRKRVAGLAASLAAVLTLAACGADQSSPDGLGEAVADAANDEDADAIAELACKKDRAIFTKDFDFAKMREQLQTDDLTFTVEFVEATTKGESATLKFKTTFENLPKKMTDMGMPNSTENEQNAIKEGENWVICN